MDPVDIPSGSLVSVAYTVNAFPSIVNRDGGDDTLLHMPGADLKSSEAEDLYLSLNLQFVIFLEQLSKKP